ncbi:MAG: hypothetical protein VBE63_08220 [Lamprobacter sp.]|uniref:hypothetical protein n=1 Tax=Lamprobacter sp. TaxID=3100796 RepID=UPI002B25C6E6|nr:hypothetical protein [Lamprobacter sp.]MEA3639914.1 hypothetical protein [Lamprobacter sp.]
MSRDTRLPTITSDIPADLRAFTDELRRALTQPSGYRAWPNHRLPHVSSQIPEDLRKLIRRIREELRRAVPSECIPKWREDEFGREWLNPRDTLPHLSSSAEQDVRRFFERVREMMVREQPEICPEEKNCDSPEGEWVTSLMYPLEFIEEMKASSQVMRGQFYQGTWDAYVPSLVVTGGYIEIIWNSIFTESWDAYTPSLEVTGGWIADTRVYAEVAEAITTTVRLTGFLKPGIFATAPNEMITSSASIVSGGLE